MKLIKFNAIDSTNSFLKELAQNTAIENFTIVVTDEQKKGRGQLENTWESEPYKNLTISVFINNINLKISDHKYLNFAISLAICKVLLKLEIKNVFIKWPNDIMAVNKKICGILIENTFKGSNIKNTIVGIGLNVNQETFPSHLAHVTSLKKITGKDYLLDHLLVTVIDEIKLQIKLLNRKEYQKLEASYLDVLYKKNIPTMFKDRKDVLFMGLITGISNAGNLLIELEDETVKEFGIKEVSLA